MIIFTINDPALITQLQNAKEKVVLQSPDGIVIGEFTLGFGRLPPGAKLPFTDEELELRHQQKGGRSLSEIMRDLEAGYPSK